MIRMMGKAVLEEHCAEFGCSIDDVRSCIVDQFNDEVFLVDIFHAAFPRGVKTPKKTSSSGLGDMVAAGLSAIGITKERVSAAVGGDCGCSKRQEQLNELGRKIGIG
jgi:hypothetical protein